MKRNKSNIFLGLIEVSIKKEGKLLQQRATCIDAVFRPFLVEILINQKNIRFIS